MLMSLQYELSSLIEIKEIAYRTSTVSKLLKIKFHSNGITRTEDL